MEPKPLASLTAGLLARKGAARPAMRRAYVPGMTAPSLPASVQDDLGWNDMGEIPPPPAPPPLTVIKSDGAVTQAEVRPPVAEIATAKAAPAKANGPKTDAKAARVTKSAFTLRLDPERHLRLRLACAMNHRSAQQIVTEALDAFLRGRPDVESLAQQVPLPSTPRDETQSD